MPLTRDEKQELIASYDGGLAQAPHAFLLDYKGVTVPQVTELRARIRDSGGQYLVVKNTLALLAIEGKALGELKEQFQGPTAVAFSAADPVALAKVLTDFAKTVPAIQFKGGVVEGRKIGADQVKEIAQLPGREELVAKLLFLLQSPVSRLARGLAALTRQLVVVLDQIRIEKEAKG